MSYLYYFDIDGTLVSTRGAGSRSFKKAVFDIFQKEPHWPSISMAGRIDKGIFKSILNHLNVEYSSHFWNDFQTIYLDYLIKESKNPSKWIIFEGVENLLKRLSEKNQKLFLLTGNLKAGAKVKLETLGLDHFFDWEGSIFADHGENNRDDLAHALKARLDQDEKAVIIGDTPNDIRVGQIVEGISVAITTGVHKKEDLISFSPDFLIDNLTRFPEDLI